MSGFHETTFPLSVALGASGGPERRTDIVTLTSGREQRNSRWADSRRRYDAASGIKTLDELHAVIAFFEERRGRLYGFRFRDRADDRSSPPLQPVTPLDQRIGTGDGSNKVFQLVKTYGGDFAPYQRKIAKPVLGSVVVAVDGGTLAANAVAVDIATGKVTLANPPAVGRAVTAGFRFDVPVRFDVDRLTIDLGQFSAGAVPATLERLWLFERHTVIDVELVRGTLSSLNDLALFDGGNLAAVGSMEGGWEVLQFRSAELIGERRYRLNGLLRGLGGTEGLAVGGHAIGADFVLLDSAVQRLPLPRDQIGRPLSLRIGDARAGIGDAELVGLSLTPAGVGLLPLAPVHLRASWDGDDIRLSWIRRVRADGDDFDAREVPLGEARETYEIEIKVGSSTRRMTVTDPSAVYAVADQIADAGAPVAAFELTVAQLSETMGAGRPARRMFHV